MEFSQNFFNKRNSKRIFLSYFLYLYLTTELSLIPIIDSKNLIETKSKIENKKEENQSFYSVNSKESIIFIPKTKIENYYFPKKNISDVIDFMPTGSSRGVIIDSSSSSIEIHII